MRILLVDDDETLMETLAESLIKQRYAVDIAVDGESAQEFLALFHYDLIVLDMLLPDAEGVALCRQFRQQDVTSPIIMLTARDTSTDKVLALDAGADDYVVKPFDFEELCARIRALLRRDSSYGTTADLQWGDLSLKPNTFEVFYGEHQLHTTPKEYAMLELFLRHPNRVFSLDTIIENIWSFEDPPSGDAVRTHVKGVRQKLRAGGAPKDFIETVYGLGYRLRPIESKNTSKQGAAVSGTRVLTKADMRTAVAQAWEAHQDTLQERLSVLEAAAAAIGVGQLSEDLQQVSRSHAHKLAGSLGCYGFSEGSRIARELESLLDLDASFDDQRAARVSTLVKNLRQNLADGSSYEVASAAIANAPQFLIVGADEALPRQLIPVAAAAGMRTLVAFGFSQAHEMLQSQSPSGVLLQLNADQFEAGISLLAAIAGRSPKIPVVLMTNIQTFQQRLQMVQQGADVILSSTTSPLNAVNATQQVFQSSIAACKIIIIDDDAQVLDLLRTVLSPWGIQLTTLDDPTQLWSILEAVQPDLLVLDVEMPEANGLDLCQVLRADEKWRHLPILFLTIHEDNETQQQAFEVGADDFIHKSAITTELPQRILNRLKRLQPPRQITTV